MVATITAITVPPLLRTARAAGGAIDDLAAAFGVPTSPRFEDRIAVSSLVSLWASAVERTGDPELPVRAATILERDERSLIAMAVAAQDTLGAAFDVFVRYFPTVTNAYRWRSEIRDEQFLLSAEARGVDELGWRCNLEFDVIDVVHVATRLAPSARPISVAFMHPQPRAIERMVAALGVLPTYSRERMELAFPRAVLTERLITAKPALVEVLEGQLAALLASAEAEEGASKAVRDLLPRLLQAGAPTADEAARRLGLGRRTLERRLDLEGTSFRALLDEVRCDLARAWLRDLSIDEVAERLAYADVRAFDRAFKRWTGTTPAAFRRSARSEDPSTTPAARPRR